jgi:hypothetical protein
MRLPDSAHTSRPWRIHEVAPDFRLEDVWALPTPGGPDDLPLLIDGFASGDPSQSSSNAARLLWAVRWKLGKLFGWDEPDSGIGSRVPTLRERLPADLRERPGPDFDSLLFQSLFMIRDEYAAEVANRTVHGVMHIGWVPDANGGYRGQMAVLVKPNGLYGRAYMAAIKPFRHVLVYPAMLRQIGRRWRERGGGAEVGPSRSAAQQVSMLAEVRAVSSLRADYEDCFVVDAGPDRDRTAEEWARAMLEGAPLEVRRGLRRGWRLLGLRLGSPRAGDRVLGWEIRRSEPDVVVLAGESLLGFRAELLCLRRGESLVFATFVEQRTLLSRLVWSWLAPIHQKVVQSLLTRARHPRADPHDAH